MATREADDVDVETRHDAARCCNALRHGVGAGISPTPPAEVNSFIHVRVASVLDVGRNTAAVSPDCAAGDLMVSARRVYRPSDDQRTQQREWVWMFDT